MRRLKAALGAAVFSAAIAGADAQADDRDVADCVDRLIREIPSWGAMKSFREQMRKSGFTVTGAVRESDPKRGRSWTAYNVQIKGENKSYRIACEDRR